VRSSYYDISEHTEVVIVTLNMVIR